jgi:hypothetical protein
LFEAVCGLTISRVLSRDSFRELGRRTEPEARDTGRIFLDAEQQNDGQAEHDAEQPHAQPVLAQRLVKWS